MTQKIKFVGDKAMFGEVELRPIPGIIGYCAGSDGFLYSFRRKGQHIKYKTTPHRLTGYAQDGRYRSQSISWMGQRQVLVHRMVASAFHGPCPEGMECSHLNGDSSDNRPENLRWETRKENCARKLEHGTTRRGDDCPASILSEDDVLKMRRMRADLVTTYKELGEMFGVSMSTAHQAVNGYYWSWLDDAGADKAVGEE